MSLSKNMDESTPIKEVSTPVSQKVSFLDSMKANLWMPATIILAVVLIIVLVFFVGKPGAAVSGNTVNANTNDLSQTTIGQKGVEFINAQLMRGNDSVTLDSVSDMGAYYEVMVNYNNRKVPADFSKDGKYFFAQVIPLNATLPKTDTTTTASAPTTPVQIEIGNSPKIGNSSAPVTVVEFSDFSCPFCGAASGQAADLVAYMKNNDPTWEAPVPGIMKDYVQTGKVQFVYKYAFGHTGGHSASSVGWCLYDQNASLYWTFYDQAFAHQADVESLDKMKALAQTLGADMTSLNSCLTAKTHDAQFDTEAAQATAAGVSGTPAFFVNGKLTEGAVSYPTLKASIDAALAGN